MGVERTISMMSGKKSVYETDFFIPLIAKLEELSSLKYGTDETNDISIRIVADHVKASSIIMSDGVSPSNMGQGYILRRLIRRAVRHGRKLGIDGQFLNKISAIVVDMYKDVYDSVFNNIENIYKDFDLEEKQFGQTLKKGEHEFEKMLPGLMKNPKKIIPGRIAFKLYDTYGFPIEITEELGREHGLSVDTDGFETAFKKHQEESKKGADKIFKGGMGDDSVMSTRYHTATHLLHKALRMVLGDHVEQKGSNITADRLRFDFSHPKKMTQEEIDKVQIIINEQIERSQDVIMDTMTVEDAREKGAMALFSAKYGEQVKVYTIGDFSMEVCGGPHVGNTSELGKLKIVKEQSSSRGVRRIKAILE